MEGIKKAFSAMQAYSLKMDAIASNLANVSTRGYKKSGIEFEIDGSDIRPISYVNLSPGDLESTGSKNDIAAAGGGFFELSQDGKKVYSRSGKIYVSESGSLVDEAGRTYSTYDEKSSLSPGVSFEISRKGEIIQEGKIAGKLKMIKAEDSLSVKPLGGGVYEINSEKKASTGDILQGYVENSNVNPVEEMASMIRVMREFERLEKTISQENASVTKMLSSMGKF